MLGGCPAGPNPLLPKDLQRKNIYLSCAAYDYQSFLLAEKKPFSAVGIKGLKCSSIGGVFHWGGKSAKKLLSCNVLQGKDF